MGNPRPPRLAGCAGPTRRSGREGRDRAAAARRLFAANGWATTTVREAGPVKQACARSDRVRGPRGTRPVSPSRSPTPPTSRADLPARSRRSRSGQRRCCAASWPRWRRSTGACSSAPATSSPCCARSAAPSRTRPVYGKAPAAPTPSAAEVFSLWPEGTLKAGVDSRMRRLRGPVQHRHLPDPRRGAALECRPDRALVGWAAGERAARSLLTLRPPPPSPPSRFTQSGPVPCGPCSTGIVPTARGVPPCTPTHVPPSPQLQPVPHAPRTAPRATDPVVAVAGNATARHRLHAHAPPDPRRPRPDRDRSCCGPPQSRPRIHSGGSCCRSGGWP